MSPTYTRFSGVCSVLAGLAGLVYLFSFLALKNPAAMLPSLSLLAVGLLASAVIVALYERVRRVDEGFARLGLLLGVAGALGSAVHAAFDLANNIHPPAAPFGYPSPVDPRGFLTFAVVGISAVILAGLVLKGNVFPRPVGLLGLVSGVLLIALYATYLISLNASDPVVLFLIFATGVLQPLWYLAVGGSLLMRERRAPARAAHKSR